MLVCMRNKAALNAGCIVLALTLLACDSTSKLPSVPTSNNEALVPTRIAEEVPTIAPLAPTPTPARTPTRRAGRMDHTRTSTSGANCDSSYPTVCIPPPPPDLDCGEIQYKNFQVLAGDPHRFDRDKDGIGCES